MVSHQRQRSLKRDFLYAKVTFLTSQNSAEYFTLIIDRYYSTASQQNLPFIKSYFMSKEIVAWLASLQHLHTTMVCKILPPPPFPHPPRTFAPTDCGSIPAPRKMDTNCCYCCISNDFMK